MRKTKSTNTQTHSIPLFPQAEEILSSYRSKEAKPEGYVFQILNPKRVYDTDTDLLKEISRKNALINKYLKQVCFKANITKDVSFHSARHTFADLGRRKIKDV